MAADHCWVCGDGSGAWLKQFMAALGLFPRHVYDDAWSTASLPGDRPSRFGLVAGLAGGLYSWDGGQRVWRRTGKRPGITFPTTRLPFYRGEHVLPKLDELTDPILWCAGQKDADTAARLGFPSIAHPGGEGACRPDLARQWPGVES